MFSAQTIRLCFLLFSLQCCLGLLLLLRLSSFVGGGLFRCDLLVFDLLVIVRPSTCRAEAVHVVFDAVVAELTYLIAARTWFEAFVCEVEVLDAERTSATSVSFSCHEQRVRDIRFFLFVCIDVLIVRDLRHYEMWHRYAVMRQADMYPPSHRKYDRELWKPECWFDNYRSDVYYTSVSREESEASERCR